MFPYMNIFINALNKFNIDLIYHLKHVKSTTSYLWNVLFNYPMSPLHQVPPI
jgi:hypothetical protein